MRDAGKHLGTAVVQRPLDLLSRMLRDTRGMGETGEMAVCARAENRRMWCFPLRANPKVSLLPYEIDGRRIPMSYALDGASGIITALDYRRQNVTAAYGPIGQLGLGMVLTQGVGACQAAARHVHPYRQSPAHHSGGAGQFG